jgi:hypothetical protein
MMSYLLCCNLVLALFSVIISKYDNIKNMEQISTQLGSQLYYEITAHKQQYQKEMQTKLL